MCVTDIQCHILATDIGVKSRRAITVIYVIHISTRVVGNAIVVPLGINVVVKFEESTAQVPRLVPRLIRS